MRQIKIYTIGKIKEPFLKEGIQEYEKRLKKMLKIEWIEAKDNDALQKTLTPPYYCFDIHGALLSSPAFSKKIIALLEKHASTLRLVIGGPEGIPREVLKNQAGSFSLSHMTFTNQFARLIVIEQIYRAMQIDLGTKYHK